MTQTDAAHLSRFEWSEQDHTGWDRSTKGREGLEKERERNERKRGRERETRLRAAVERPRRTGREFSDERDSPSRRASRWRRSICCSFFSYPLVPLARPSRSSFLSSFSPLFLSLRQNSRPREFSLFFMPFFHRFLYFPFDLSFSLSVFLSLSLSLSLDFFFAFYHRFSFRCR